MLGSWCSSPEIANTFGKHEDEAYRPRKKKAENCAGFIEVEPHRFTSDEYHYCLFDKVEHSGSQTWWVHARCIYLDPEGNSKPKTKRQVFTFQGLASDDNKWIGLFINDMTGYSN